MGRGGARFGAGRPGWRLKAEHCCRIDVRVWHRLHGFRDGYSGSWVWNVGGEPAGSISYSVSEHAVTLRYSTNGTSIAEPENRMQLRRASAMVSLPRVFGPRCPPLPTFRQVRVPALPASGVRKPIRGLNWPILASAGQAGAQARRQLGAS
jgi:hypothetical protein